MYVVVNYLCFIVNMFADKPNTTKRTCAKCGIKYKEDLMHRFPKLGARNALRCEAWARYVYTDKECYKPDFQNSLHNRCLMLCGNHFKASSFTDSTLRKLHRSAIPDEECDRMTGISPQALPFAVTLDPYVLQYHIEGNNSSGKTVHNSDNKADNSKVHIVSEEVVVPQGTPLTGANIAALTEKPTEIPEIETNTEKVYQESSNIDQEDRRNSTAKKFDEENTSIVVPSVETSNNVNVEDPFKCSQATQRHEVQQTVTKDIAIEEPTFKDPLEVNQGYEVEVQETAAAAYSTDDDDDYQPDAASTVCSEDDDYVSEHATRRQTRQVTGSHVSAAADHGPCWCCLQQGAHSVADIPALLHCLNVPLRLPPALVARVCADCAGFLERAARFRDMVLCSQQALSERRPVVKLDNSIEEDENTSLRLEYVSETGKVRDMKVPLKDLYFDSSGHLVQYALEDNEETDDGETENDPPTESEEELKREEYNKRKNTVQDIEHYSKRQRTSITNEKPNILTDVRESPEMSNKNIVNVALTNTRNLNQSNVQPTLAKLQTKRNTQTVSNALPNVQPKKATTEFQIKQIAGQLPSTSNFKQPRVVLMKPVLKQNINPHNIATKAKAQPIVLKNPIVKQDILNPYNISTEASVQPTVVLKKPIVIQNMNPHNISRETNVQPKVVLKKPIVIQNMKPRNISTEANVQPTVVLKKPIVIQNIKQHNIATKAKAQPIVFKTPIVKQNINPHNISTNANVQRTIEIKIEQFAGKFLASTRNISNNE